MHHFKTWMRTKTGKTPWIFGVYKRVKDIRHLMRPSLPKDAKPESRKLNLWLPAIRGSKSKSLLLAHFRQTNTLRQMISIWCYVARNSCQLLACVLPSWCYTHSMPLLTIKYCRSNINRWNKTDVASRTAKRGKNGYKCRRSYITWVSNQSLT